MFAPQAQTHLSASLLAKQHLLTFELALALRVTLQKPLDVSGRLPAHLPVSLPGVSHSSAQLTEKVGACLSEMVGVLDAEVGRKELSGQKRNRELERDSEGAIDLDSAWELISSQQQQLQPKWEAVTNKWHARLNFGSEKAKAKMKTFTHSLWDQVGDTLLDERRAKEKSRLPLADSRRVDVTRSSRSGAQEESAPGESAREVAYDEEVYDDRMFYALLLKAFITSSANSSSDQNAMRAADYEALRQYKRKKLNVDRKASKGRKVRYNVHAKLQNFMFPMPTASAFETTGPQDADKLFQSLFQ